MIARMYCKVFSAESHSVAIVCDGDPASMLTFNVEDILMEDTKLREVQFSPVDFSFEELSNMWVENGYTLVKEFPDFYLKDGVKYYADQWIEKQEWREMEPPKWWEL